MIGVSSVGLNKHIKSINHDQGKIWLLHLPGKKIVVATNPPKKAVLAIPGYNLTQVGQHIFKFGTFTAPDNYIRLLALHLAHWKPSKVTIHDFEIDADAPGQLRTTSEDIIYPAPSVTS